MSTLATSTDAATAGATPIDAVTLGSSIVDGSLLKATANLTIDTGNDKAVKGKSEESGAYSGQSTDGNGYNSKMGNWSPPTSFVRSGRSQSEDPFQSASAIRHTHNLTNSPKSSRIKNENWRSASASNASSAGDASPIDYTSRYGSGSPGKRLSSARPAPLSAVNPEDAQAHFPPGYCVFVANLLQSENEETLQMAVTQVFRQYGPVYVKIRRDAKHMPFAFCQYTNAEDAERAIRLGRGELIRGRPCRCEKAKAHRLFIIERKSGEPITSTEARLVLREFGKIDRCYSASDLERATFHLGEAVIVQFEMYDNGQNAQSALRNHEKYKFMALPQFGTSDRVVRAPSIDPAAKDYNDRYEVDRVSLFCGNLAAGTTKDQVTGLFRTFGNLVNVILREPPSKFESGEKQCFAFVEFAEVLGCVKAIATMDGYIFNGRALRVKPKQTETTMIPRLRAAAPVRSYESPARRRFDSPTSPVSQMSTPPAYSSPYAYPYSPAYYGYGASPAMSDGQNYYHPAPYSPQYYPYPAGIPGPCYDPRSTAPSEVGSSPNYQSGYYAYSPYQYPPSPYWSAPAVQTTEQHPSLVPYYPPGQGNVNTENLSTTTDITEGQVATTEPSVGAPADV